MLDDLQKKLRLKVCDSCRVSASVGVKGKQCASPLDYKL